MFQFSVRCLSSSTTTDLPPFLSVGRRRAILEQLQSEDLGEIPDSDVAELLQLVLQDLGEDDAALALLDLLLVDDSTAGRRQQLVHELRDEAPHERYPDIASHAALYVVAALLREAFGSSFPIPRAQRVRIEVRSDQEGATEGLIGADPPLVARLLAQATEHAVLRRVFSDAVDGEAAFPEAAAVLWHIAHAPGDAGLPTLTVWSSQHWLDGIEKGAEWSANARTDSAIEDEA